jgi:hypothetical protein
MLAATSRMHLERHFKQSTGFFSLHQSLQLREQADRQHPPATASHDVAEVSTRRAHYGTCETIADCD